MLIFDISRFPSARNVTYLDELFNQNVSRNCDQNTWATHLLIAQVQELVQLDTTVRECAERALLLELSREGGVGDLGVLHSQNTPSALRPPSYAALAAPRLTILRCRGRASWRPAIVLRACAWRSAKMRKRWLGRGEGVGTRLYSCSHACARRNFVRAAQAPKVHTPAHIVG